MVVYHVAAARLAGILIPLPIYVTVAVSIVSPGKVVALHKKLKSLIADGAIGPLDVVSSASNKLDNAPPAFNFEVKVSIENDAIISPLRFRADDYVKSKWGSSFLQVHPSDAIVFPHSLCILLFIQYYIIQ